MYTSKENYHKKISLVVIVW